jgi:hypothetical protein
MASSRHAPERSGAAISSRLSVISSLGLAARLRARPISSRRRRRRLGCLLGSGSDHSLDVIPTRRKRSETCSHLRASSLPCSLCSLWVGGCCSGHRRGEEGGSHHSARRPRAYPLGLTCAALPRSHAPARVDLMLSAWFDVRASSRSHALHIDHSSTTLTSSGRSPILPTAGRMRPP